MSVYSLYIFDRRCTCIYYQDWSGPGHTAKTFKPGGEVLPGVLRSASTAALPPGQRFSQRSTGVIVSMGEDEPLQAAVAVPSKGLPFDEEAKLVYGVVFSLRNMVRRLAGRDEAFVAFSTSAYKLHFLETPTCVRFVLLTDPRLPSLRSTLKALYAGPFIDHVVRNPSISSIDSARTGRGIDNDAFRTAVDNFVRSVG